MNKYLIMLPPGDFWEAQIVKELRKVLIWAALDMIVFCIVLVLIRGL